jgi:ParB family chromosome partitioning protein
MPDPTPDTIHRIALAEIDDAALTRDRNGLDEAALTELRLSIAASGLRMPVELFALSEPRPPHNYGLLSGLRRLHAYQALNELTGDERYAAIPAFLRAPGSMAEALTSMVEENEIRADLSPWERGRIAWVAHRQEIFPTIEEAVAKLYPAANRAKRARLRALAHLAGELDGHLTHPERLSQSQALRLSAAVQAGFGEVIRTALEESTPDSPQAQWQILLPILTESETPLPETPKPGPGCPRRISRPRPGLTIRREQTRDGYSLHFTGRDATSWLLDDVFGDIERKFEPG